MHRSIGLIAILVYVTSFSQNCAQLSVYFGSNKSRLKNAAKSQIDSLVSSLDSSETYLIEVSGFADSLGTFEYNNKLARKRATNISSYIKSKRSNRILIKQFTYGETFRQQKEDKKNRRVEIFYTKIHRDSTIEIKGEQGERVYLPYWFFWSSTCNVNPQIVMKSNGNSQMEFSMTFDHLDSSKPCDSPGFTILGLNQFDFVSYNLTSGRTVLSSTDSVYLYKPYTFNEPIILDILAEYGGEIYEGSIPLDSLRLSKIHNTKTRDEYRIQIGKAQNKCLGIYYIGTSDLNKVKRSKKLIKIKIPRNAEIDSIGFRLKPSGYFILMNKIDKRCYEHLHLKTRYDIAVYHHNTMTLLKKSKIKKVKKRGYLKVRKKDLK